MSGIKFLLDTNIVIGLLKQGLEILPKSDIKPENSAISQITRIELLSFPQITLEEERVIKSFVNAVTVISVSEVVEKETISFRRARGGKFPDAIIIATALAHNLELVTLDSRMKNAYLSAIENAGLE